MGGGSGKGRKKRAGKLKARQAALKDSNAYDDEDRSDQLSEELTALAAIFQDDFNLISEKPFVEFCISIRPHSVDDGDGEDYVAVDLFVRCLPGYPQRPPKLQITSTKGLADGQLQYLHSMLADQAASIAREGRVMIFNLTEIAQEFLSDQCKAESSLEEQISNEESGVPTSRSTAEDGHPSIPSATPAADDEPESDDSIFLDLFNNLWYDNDVQLEESHVLTSTIQPTGNRRGALDFKAKQFWENTKRSEPLAKANLRTKNVAEIELRKSIERLVVSRGPSQADLLKVVAEECEENEEVHPFSRNGWSKSASELLQQVHAALVCEGHTGEHCECVERNSSHSSDGAASEEDSPGSSSNDLQVPPSADDSATQSIRKDLVLGYLLRLACSHRGPLPQALPVLASELQNVGILSQWAKDLVSSQPQLFDAMFRQMFGQLSKNAKLANNLTTSAADSFWSANPELLGNENDTLSITSSRYSSDFEELFLLGKGGFGHVVLCKNKLDGRRYAMKKIRLKDESPIKNEKILREVATLARLQHHHVVRYYQAWIETGVGHLQSILSGGIEDSQGSENNLLRERTSVGSSLQSLSAADEETKSTQTTFLYIQMEYCPRTLREVFDSYSGSFNKDEIWRMFRQLVEGLAHIHGQGILHRDLTPNNIFFDAHGDIKIGDFGLAKFSNLEQPDWEPKAGGSAEPSGTYFEGTGEVGTYFYTAPEMDQGLPHIDVKVDIYSLGVVFFEFWYPFSTAMERYIILNDLKQKGSLPATWSSEFIQQATLVRWLMAPSPAERPSAAQVLRSELLPPRMENESLNDILRTIQKAEDTSVYDQVVAAMFDSERISARAAQIDSHLANLKRLEKDKSLIKLVGVRDPLLESVKEVFVCHGAQGVESSCFNVVDDLHHPNRQAANLLDTSGNMLDVRHEPRLLLARWVAVNQRMSLKTYELSRVYRRSVGDNAPREFFQGDFDIIGGAQTLAEAEAVKVAVEVVSKFPVFDVSEVRVNHRQILRAIWNWTGVQSQLKQKVIQILAVLGSAPPQSSARKALWPIVRRQLLQGLHLAEAVVDRLQTVERRLTGSANEVLPRLRGALPPSEEVLLAIDELATLLRYLRIWDIEELVRFDALMAASENFLSGVFFQVHVQKTSNAPTIAISYNNRNMLPSTCIAVGGRYSQLIAKYWNTYMASPPPGAVGLSIAVQRLMDATAVESTKSDGAAEVLVCSKGGGGLLMERMEIANDLWSANIKAEYLCSEAPSFTEQYEYAHENGIKWLVIITEAALSLAGTVKVRHLDLKIEEDVRKVDLVKHFNDISSTPVNLRKKTSSMRATN